ncbi:MAG: hypothetical protein ACYC5S_11105 [Thiobacillus sp.]
MERIGILQQRLERAKAALREEKRRAKAQEQQRIFDLVRRSGLTLADLETMLANRPVAGDDFESGKQQ